MTDTPENSCSPPMSDRLLDAAEQIVARDGVGKLTLDAVAHEAGVSKGGLLYHFPSKQALIMAVVERHVRRCESRQAATLAADPQSAGAFTRAYLSARISSPLLQDEPVHVAVLAAIGTDPQYLDPLRKRLTEWQARLESDGIDAATACIVRLAIDGLLVGRLLNVSIPEGELRDRVVEKLLAMTQPQATEKQGSWQTEDATAPSIPGCG